MPKTHPTNWNNESLARFDEKSCFRLDQFLENHGFVGCDRRLIFIDYDQHGQSIIRWMENATINEKARVFCREYLKSYPTNKFAAAVYEVVSEFEIDISDVFPTLTDLIEKVEKFER